MIGTDEIVREATDTGFVRCHVIRGAPRRQFEVPACCEATI